MRVVVITRQKNSELEEPEQAILFTTNIGGSNYLNVAGMKPEQLTQIQEKGRQANLVDTYFLLKYQLKDDSLLAWPVDDIAQKKAIRSGKVKGETKKTDDETATKFTDTTKNLARLVADTKGKLFSETTHRFERMR